MGGGDAQEGFVWCAAAASAAARPALVARIKLTAAVTLLSAGELSTAVPALQVRMSTIIT